jgi:hypothetical protein
MRKIGIEIEYYGLSPIESAECTQKQLSGEIEREHDDLVKLHTKLGVFRFETDATFIRKLSALSEENKKSELVDFDGFLRKLITFFSEEFVPTEMISPPLPINELPKITEVHRFLHQAGAEGTLESLRFAFGAQLNPEIKSLDPESLLNHLRSFLILQKWLENQIQVDLTRKITQFAGDFPKSYQRRIFQKDYKPDFDTFLDDYLRFNPTRNRCLDLLPLLAYFNENKVKNAIGDAKCNPRPTFHYRLPNSQLSLQSWSIEIEWSRWLLVEKLLETPVLFNEMMDVYTEKLEHQFDFNQKLWLLDLNHYVERLRSCDP